MKLLKDKITLRGMVLAIGGLLLWTLISLITGSFCWFQAVFGVPCPGCGSMRATQALIQGEFALAFYYHPLIILSFGLCLYFVIRYLVFMKKQLHKLEKYIIICIFIIYMGVFITRMIFLFPHSEPLIPLETALWRLIIGLIL